MSEPKFKVGDILRHDTGSTALFIVESVSPNHGTDHRYYGRSTFGSMMGEYEKSCRPASKADLRTWKANQLQDPRGTENGD